ncbi:Oxysterol-binding protein [Jaminaea rosea]|uniref:Oxysterol-binding protein n=1 Tax=Jaminaea rosea TaxID=1569628 RepID=A0A316UR39_9BASI|nr:Oxysterol-binding protein [Jaminaea rosea]PWN25595.1 Oxysterol-binding protein [Jaminaea rosea]
MGLLDHVNSAVSGAKSAVGHSKEDGPPQGASADDTEELDEESGNILLSLIGQLRIGMDLSKVTLPTFCLEPRSMLERITDFMSHPDLIFGTGKQDNAEERFIAVTRYYLSGWHIKPKGVKKPYNPVLGEWFQCSYKYGNGTEGFYIAEQVSHHPPISAYYYVSPENDLIFYGELKPKSKFLGNSAATIMGGENRVALLDRPEDGEYEIGMPNMYARGIMFGKMVLELGDHSKITNANNDMSADVEFKTKGYFTGTYNAIAGRVTHSGKHIGDISGKWSDEMDYKEAKGGASRELFNAKKAQFAQKSVRPEEEQEEFESRRLWARVTEGIKEKNLDKATDAKSAIEDAQRQRVKEREEKGEVWKPRFFEQVGDKFVPKLEALPSDAYRPEKAVKWFEKRRA